MDTTSYGKCLNGLGGVKFQFLGTANNVISMKEIEIRFCNVDTKGTLLKIYSSLF